MSDPAAIARDYLESFNRRDFDHVRELLHSTYSYTGADGDRQDGGPEVGIAVMQMWANAFPDANVQAERVHVSGDTAVVEFMARGTHQGELMGVAATGRKVEMPVCTILDIKDGKIGAEREYMDLANMMQQLGVMPAPATA